MAPLTHSLPFLTVFICCALAFIVSGCGLGQPSADTMIFPGKDWTFATPESQGLDSVKLNEAMQIIADIAEDHKNGTKNAGNTQVMVIRNGRVIWAGEDIDNFHRIHSCSKSFLSMTFGLLVDDGKCTPDTLAADILPELSELYPEVTLGQFANFTSGYNVPWRESAFEIRSPIHAPGKGFHYSASSNQLAQLLTRIGKKPLKDLFAERIANEIGMDPTQWDWAETGEIDGLTVYGGSGHISTTARQLARFGLLALNYGNWDGKQLLSREWMELSTKPQVSPDTPPYEKDGWYLHLPGRYGYNWWLNGRDSAGKLLWPAAPERMFVAQGNLNNYCFVIPEWNMVIVRMGMGKAIHHDPYNDVFVKIREAFIEE